MQCSCGIHCYLCFVGHAQCFSTLSHKRYEFRKVTEHKMSSDFHYNCCLKQISLCCLYRACISDYCLQVGLAVCTYLNSQAKFRHVSVSATTIIISVDNTTDQKHSCRRCLSFHTHIAIFRVHLQHRTVYVTLPTYVSVWWAVPSGLEVPLEGSYACANL